MRTSIALPWLVLVTTLAGGAGLPGCGGESAAEQDSVGGGANDGVTGDGGTSSLASSSVSAAEATAGASSTLGGAGGTTSTASSSGGATSTASSGGAAAGGSASGGDSSAAGSSCVASAVTGTQVEYDLSAAQAATANDFGFYAYPWPELSRAVTELAHVPNPTAATGCTTTLSDALLSSLVSNIDPVTYRAYVAELASQFLTDSSNQAQILMHFDGAIDESNLPTALDSLDAATSPILVVDLEATATRGRLVPVLTRVLNDSLYAEANTLSILPHPGFPLTPNHLYAALVRRSLGDATGAKLGSPAAFEAKKLTGACADGTYASAFDFLESEFALDRDDVAMMTVFRTGSPTHDLVTRLTEIDSMTSPTTLANVTVPSTEFLVQDSSYYVITGTFETLIVQEGNPPYLPAVSGLTVTFDPASTDGRLLTSALPTSAGGTDTTLPRTETLDFQLVVPASVTAGASLPVVIYGPGTGGTIDSAVSSGVATELAAQGIATFATTPVMHQERAHSENIDSSLLSLLALLGYDDQLITTVESGDLFFNPLDLQAAKGNSLQAAVDYAWQAKILSELSLSVNLGGNTVDFSFDSNQISYLGHSQGAATGPLLATAQAVTSEVLSAPAGHLSTNLLGKTMPADSLSIASMLDYIICDNASTTIDAHHPFLNLLLHWFDQSDAANYAPMLAAEAPSQPKHVLVLAGTEDHYVAPESHNAVTTAARLHQLSPSLSPVIGQTLLASLEPSSGYGVTYDSLSGNRIVGSTSVTAAFRQYHGSTSDCSDDHFVYTCTSDGLSDWKKFLATLMTSGTPTVP